MTAAPPVSDELIADLYLRLERVEAEVRQLRLQTLPAPHADPDPPPTPPRPAPRVSPPDTPGHGPETRPVGDYSEVTPPVIRWPVPKLPPPAAEVGEAALLEAAFDRLPAAVGLDAGGRVRLWNPAAAALFGWAAADVAGRPPPFVPADKAVEHYTLCRSPHAAGPAGVATVRTDAAGRRLAVRAEAAASRCGGVVLLFHPAAEVAAGDAPADAGDPAAAGRYAALGRVVAGVAHDFNTTLTVVRGHAELLAEGLPPTGPLADAAGAVVAAAALGEAVSRQLCDAAGPDAAGPGRADVGDLLRRTGGFVRTVAGAGVRVAVAAPAGLPPAAADPTAVFRVLLNLVADARDALAGGGRLDVRAAAVVVPPGRFGWPPGVTGGAFVALTVADSGAPGGPAGPGLAAVRDIVSRAGGHVETDSAPGWGTVRTAYFRRG